MSMMRPVVFKLLLSSTALFIAANAVPTQRKSGPWPEFNKPLDKEVLLTLINYSKIFMLAGIKSAKENYGKEEFREIINLLSALSKKVENDDKIPKDEVAHTFMDIFFNYLMSVVGKNMDPNNKLNLFIFDAVTKFLSIAGRTWIAEAQGVVPRFNQGNAAVIAEAFMSFSDGTKADT